MQSTFRLTLEKYYRDTRIAAIEANPENVPVGLSRPVYQCTNWDLIDGISGYYSLRTAIVVLGLFMVFAIQILRVVNTCYN